jgi:hypothetical protein
LWLWLWLWLSVVVVIVGPNQFSRAQFLLRQFDAMTVHKCQALAVPTVIEIGSRTSAKGSHPLRCPALPRCGAQQISQSSEQHSTRPLNVVDIVSKPWSIQRICDLVLDSCYAVVVGPGHFSAGHIVAGGRVACLFAERGNIPRVAGYATLSLWRLLYL